MAQVVALFIVSYENDVIMDYIRFIMKQFLLFNMINVNVISYRYETNIVQVHTFYPYDGYNCANEVNELTLLEECVYSDDDPDEPEMAIIETIRPKIPRDLHECELRIAASSLEPFVFDDSEKGTEILMTRTIAKAMNMKPVYRYINETRETRLISNETGIYSLLLKR